MLWPRLRDGRAAKVAASRGKDDEKDGVICP